MNISNRIQRAVPVAVATLFLSCLAPAGEETSDSVAAPAAADAITVVYALDDVGPDWRGDKDAVGMLPLNLSLDWGNEDEGVMIGACADALQIGCGDHKHPRGGLRSRFRNLAGRGDSGIQQLFQ